MNAVDTNVLIYRADWNETTKQPVARDLVNNLSSDPEPTFLLWQVLVEFVAQMSRWENREMLTGDQFTEIMNSARNLFTLVLPTPEVLDRALELSERYSISHWDSMILGACIEAGVDTLYTEDMGAPTRYESVNLVNPFV